MSRARRVKVLLWRRTWKPCSCQRHASTKSRTFCAQIGPYGNQPFLKKGTANIFLASCCWVIGQQKRVACSRRGPGLPTAPPLFIPFASYFVSKVRSESTRTWSNGYTGILAPRRTHRQAGASCLCEYDHVSVRRDARRLGRPFFASL